MIRKLVCIIGFIFISLAGFSQELEMIYEKASEALGGKERWESVSTMFVEGNWSFPHDESHSFVCKLSTPDMAKITFMVDTTMHTVSRYGRKGWVEDPTEVIKGYSNFDDVEKMVATNSFLYENNLVDYEKKGLELKFEGSVVIADEEVWLVRVEGFPNKEELYYISQDDYRPFIKQSYYFWRGRNGVVNYYIKRYMEVDGIQVPKEVLVTSEHLNLILNYSSYVFNTEMDSEEFKDPNEPDFTTNSLSLSKEEVQDYLHDNIPMTRNMGIEVQSLSTNEVKLRAPISLNVNHMRSAFGGSVDSLFLTAGWTYIRLLTDHFEPLPLIVGSKAQTTYQRPITRDFSARIVIPSKKEVKKFLKEYEKNGRANISLDAVIEDNGKTYAVFTGDYVLVKSPRSTRPPGEP